MTENRRLTRVMLEIAERENRAREAPGEAEAADGGHGDG